MFNQIKIILIAYPVFAIAVVNAYCPPTLPELINKISSNRVSNLYCEAKNMFPGQDEPPQRDLVSSSVNLYSVTASGTASEYMNHSSLHDEFKFEI